MNQLAPGWTRVMLKGVGRATMIQRTVVVILAALFAACGGRTEPAAVEPPAEALVVRAIVVAGQSNVIGRDRADAPAGLPDARVRFFRRDLARAEMGSFGPLDVAPHDQTFAHELRLAQRLADAGEEVAVIMIGQGSEAIARWLPSVEAAPGGVFYGELAVRVAELRSLYPDGTRFEFLWVWDQGENEARLANARIVEQWSDHFAVIQREIEGVLGQELDPLVVRTSSTVPGKNAPGLLEAEQASVVTTPERLIDTNDLPFMADGLHRTGAAQNAIGERLADRVLVGRYTGAEGGPM